MIYLLVDFGSTYTKLTAVDLEKEEVVATARELTTVDTDIHEGYHHALDKIQQEMPNTQFDKIIACSSAAGGLKMAAIGLVEELTVEAAKRVCLGAGGKVDLIYANHITTKETENIKTSKIDIVLLAGGTDGGNTECVLHNAVMLGKAGIDIPIIYAGNKACQDQIQEIFEEYQLNGYLCDNVMPRLNVLHIESARETIRQIFMTKIIEAKGIKVLEDEIDEIILPTPHAVLKAVELLSTGYIDEQGYGDIVAVDIGGATTDVYSIGSGSPKRADVLLRGLDEPFAKRTVEGDLGMRYSAMGIVKSMSREEIDRYHEQEIDLIKEAEMRHDHIGFVPEDEYEEKIDELFGEIATDLAFSRHTGKMESIYTPLGMMYYQIGKDLTEVKYVIGTGGVLIYNSHPQEILRRVTTDGKKPMELRPKNPHFVLDRSYILSAMGLLSLSHPKVALKIMKKNMELL